MFHYFRSFLGRLSNSRSIIIFFLTVRRRETWRSQLRPKLDSVAILSFTLHELVREMKLLYTGVVSRGSVALSPLEHIKSGKHTPSVQVLVIWTRLEYLKQTLTKGQPWYELRGWLGVKNQLHVYQSNWWQVRQVKKSFPFGTAVNAPKYDDNAAGGKYRDVIHQHFNWAVLENALKWKSIERQRVGILSVKQPEFLVHCIGTRQLSNLIFFLFFFFFFFEPQLHAVRSTSS